MNHHSEDVLESFTRALTARSRTSPELRALFTEHLSLASGYYFTLKPGLRALLLDDTAPERLKRVHAIVLDHGIIGIKAIRSALDRDTPDALLSGVL